MEEETESPNLTSVESNESDAPTDFQEAVEAAQDEVYKGCWANIYLVTRHFGGREEGGWYFNAGEAVGTLLLLPGEDRAKVRKNLKKRYEHFAWGDIYSVNGGAAIEIYFEDHIAEDWPKQRPTYG